MVEFPLNHRSKKEFYMSDGVYKVIELVGTSTESWEEAAITDQALLKSRFFDVACKS